jgi:hypothetical protein
MIQVDTTDYRRFIVRMNQINETFTINAATMMKKIAADAFVDIVNMTPVKTGNARANWWPSIDAPSTEEISFDGGGDVESNRATATNHAMFRTARINAVPVSEPPPDIWISNNVSYIGLLEDGHSTQQAPAGIVRMVLPKIAVDVTRIARGLLR